jgi:hypothetical protein
VSVNQHSGLTALRSGELPLDDEALLTMELDDFTYVFKDSRRTYGH